MSKQTNDPLLLAGKVLTILMQGFMVIGGLAIIAAFIAVAFFNESIVAELATESGAAATNMPVFPLLGILLIAGGVIAAVYTFFGKLRQIIATVGEGDPFVPENADRLNFMAWLLTGVYLAMAAAAGLSIFIAEWAKSLKDADFSTALSFDLSAILMIIVLFILARVFRQGAAMREDLEGTV